MKSHQTLRKTILSTILLSVLSKSLINLRQNHYKICNEISVNVWKRILSRVSSTLLRNLQQNHYKIYNEISSNVWKRISSRTSSKLLRNLQQNLIKSSKKTHIKHFIKSFVKDFIKIATKSSSKSHQKLEKSLIKSLKKVSSKVSSKTSSKLWRNLHQNLIKSCEIKLQYFDEKSNCCERRKFALIEEKSKVTERAVSPSRVTLTHQISSNKKTFIDRKKIDESQKKFSGS